MNFMSLGRLRSLFVLFTLSILFPLVPQLTYAQTPPGPPPKPQQHPMPPPPDPVPQEQFVAYWTSETGWTSELQLRNNALAQELTVTPVLRLADGAETSLAPVTIKPQEVKSVDLDAAISAASAPQLVGAYGSVALRYLSPSSGTLYAAMMIRRTGHPVAFHIDAVPELQDVQAGSHEGVWWLPGETTSDYLILTNQGKNVLTLDLSLYDPSGKQSRQKVVLGPYQTSRFSIRKLARAAGLAGSYGGIKVSAAAHAGSLDTLHFLFDESAGFSAILKMFDYNPTTKLEERDYAHTGIWTVRAPMLALSSPDPALAFPPGTTLHPQLFVRNTTGKPADVALRFNWRAGSATGKALGPQLRLSPYETRRIDVAALQDGITLPKQANWTSVTLTTNSKPDELMAVAASYDDTLKYGAQTPFSDQLTFKWKGGMWEVDPYHDSIITAGNGGTKPTQTAFTLFYNQGASRYDLEQTLQPDEQMWIDVGKLIREQVPDKNGKTLPPDLTMGSYEFRDLTDTAVGSLFEGKIIYDKTYGHVAYGCGMCCGYSQVAFWFDPLGVPLGLLGSNGVNGFMNCDAMWEDVSTSFYSVWSTANQAIATVDGRGTHTGVSVGSTTSQTSGTIPSIYQASHCPLVQRTPSGNDNVMPKILLGGPNGTNITNTTQSVVVGQQIVLYASYGNITPTSQSWTVLGTTVGGFNTASTNGGSTATNFTQQSTTFYWVAAANSQTVTFTLNYGSSQTATASATFNIAGPTSPLITASLGNWQIGSGPILELGSPGPSPGIAFSKSATPPLGFPGAFKWVQVVTKSNFVCTSGTTKNVNETTPALDTTYPFSSQASTTDSPEVGLPAADNRVTWDFSAQMFLMWSPSVNQTDIYVPLGYVTWQFFGDAAQAGGTWTVQSDSNRNANGFVQSSSYPQWGTTLGSLTPCP